MSCFALLTVYVQVTHSLKIKYCKMLKEATHLHQPQAAFFLGASHHITVMISKLRCVETEPSELSSWPEIIWRNLCQHGTRPKISTACCSPQALRQKYIKNRRESVVKITGTLSKNNMSWHPRMQVKVLWWKEESIVYVIRIQNYWWLMWPKTHLKLIEEQQKAVLKSFFETMDTASSRQMIIRTVWLVISAQWVPFERATCAYLCILELFNR